MTANHKWFEKVTVARLGRLNEGGFGDKAGKNPSIHKIGQIAFNLKFPTKSLKNSAPKNR